MNIETKKITSISLDEDECTHLLRVLKKAKGHHKNEGNNFFFKPEIYILEQIVELLENNE